MLKRVLSAFGFALWSDCTRRLLPRLPVLNQFSLSLPRFGCPSGHCLKPPI